MENLSLIKIKADIETVTGLHIGSGHENIEIGGLDLPIIKNPKNGLPYIPGSSLKGKMRFLTEWSHGKCGNGNVCDCGESDCIVCRIFGTTANPKNEKEKRGPTRLIVRDAELKEKEVFDRDKHIEVKWENTIDRTTGTAKNPRPLERVVPGIIFSSEIIYRVFNINNDNGETDKKYFKKVIEALQLLENDTLGGSGSRGCGQIAFRNIDITGGPVDGRDYPDIASILAKFPKE